MLDAAGGVKAGTVGRTAERCGEDVEVEGEAGEKEAGGTDG